MTTEQKPTEQKPFSDDEAKIIAAFLLKMEALGVKARFKRVVPGPVVTGFYFTPDAAVPLSRIMRREEDFALAAQVESVQLNREFGDVVIQVPNKERRLIDFKDSLHWLLTSKETSKMELPIILGVNHLGEKAALDLTEQPHILIAGQTGSGKSIFQAAIISALNCFRSPAELQIILVDTKGLDLPLFAELSHIETLITKFSKFHPMMEGLLAETRLRMERIKGAKVRNIKEYNAMFGGISMPYKLLVIDELADLIETDRVYRRANPKEAAETPSVQKWLQLLVQIARAAGVHVIAGTQRSSVTIISGDVKANLPCRISFKLPTRDDSKTILGEMGAENLLGRGDMLIQRSGAESLERYHGPFIRLEDIANIINNSNHIREMYASQRSTDAESR